jgi:hypothetical protein
MNKYQEALDCLAVLHQPTSTMLLKLARDLRLDENDRRQINFFAGVAARLLLCCDKPQRMSRFPGAPSEGVTTFSLCELHKRTTELITDCARVANLEFVFENTVIPAQIHALTLELHRAVGGR